MLLKDYLKSNKIRYEDFAKEVGISKKSLSNMVSQKRGAGKNLAKRIEAVTQGKVSRLEALYPEDFEEVTDHGVQISWCRLNLTKK